VIIRIMMLASLLALVGLFVISIDHPLGYAACALVAAGAAVFTFKKAKRAVGSDGFGGDLPPHVRRALEGRKKK
jgi:hypothetical protein